MEWPISPRQLKYLNILLTEHFGQNRKLYLKLFWNVDSSKSLTKDQAHIIIEKFVPGPDTITNVAEANERIYEAQGQQKLIK